MIIVNTKNWAHKPDTNYSLRLGKNTYECLFKVGNFALIRKRK